MLSESIFLKACRLEKTLRTPVWLMRQAGRYMKDYRALREKTPFIELCKNKDLAAEITVKAQERIGADAAIIFSDILLIVEPMGLSLDYLKGDGPAIRRRISDAKDIEALQEAVPEENLSFVLDAIRLTRKMLKADIPLIGFAGAPFTLASYMIEGGSTKDFDRTRALMRADEGLWKTLMEKIARQTVRYLEAQIRAGVQAVQLFDSWAGVLSGEDYERYVLPYSTAVIRPLKGKVPVIHFGTRTGPFIEKMNAAGADVLGVDHRIGLAEAWARIGPRTAVQGNLDPETLLKPLTEIKKEARRVLAEAAGRPGHIFNLGHGVLPETPEESVTALIEFVREESSRKS